MIAAMNRALREAELRPALRAWWRPRLERIAGWLLEADAAHRAAARSSRFHSETLGRLMLPGPAGIFVSAGKPTGSTGAPTDVGDPGLQDRQPSRAEDIDAGFAPQLPLEAAMAAAGAFGTDATGSRDRADLLAPDRWRLAGGGARAVQKGSGGHGGGVGEGAETGCDR